MRDLQKIHKQVKKELKQAREERLNKNEYSNNIVCFNDIFNFFGKAFWAN